MLKRIMSVDVAPKRPKTARPRREEGHAAPAPESKSPRRGLSVVVPGSPPKESGDWSGWYLTDEEDMGQSIEQDQIILVFRSSVTMLALERHWEPGHIGADQFFAWIEEEPLVRVSADVYVVDHPLPSPLPKMWETWQPGRSPPRFALEIVSEDWKKDYEQSPLKYDQLGTRELVIFDPEAARGSAPQRRRVPLQVYCRQADGSFVRAARGDGPVRSEELDAWLTVRFDGPLALLRIARDPAGLNLVPTQDEARIGAERRQRQEQAARQEAEEMLAEAERRQRQEQAARQEAEQKLAEALAELAQLRKKAAE